MTNFIGNISKTAATRTVNVGGVPTLVTDFNVAENYRKADGTQGTQFYRCSLWRDKGAKLAQYLKSGRAVGISGRVKGRGYLTQEIVDQILAGADWKKLTIPCQLEIANPQIQLIGKNEVDAPAEPAEELPPVEEDSEEDKPF